MKKIDYLIQLSCYHQTRHNKTSEELKQMKVKELKNLLASCIEMKGCNK